MLSYKLKHNSAVHTDSKGIKERVSSDLFRAMIDIEEGNLIISNGGNPIIRNDFDDGSYIKNSDGTTGRPIEIGLGHELIHADRIISNETIEDNDSNPDFYNTVDPDSGEKGVLYDEEIKVRELENVLREEQDVKPRATPVVEKQDLDFNPK
ncbi:MAG: hypothetical protein VR77_06175 [Flavobacteriales bacterium BRH_c54]|nr:MAG: hypothetical protein VR77_06175 [Flavobacteriales bacterium BRH_c54]